MVTPDPRGVSLPYTNMCSVVKGHSEVRSRRRPLPPRARQLEEALAPRDQEVVGVVHVHVDDGGRLPGAYHLPAAVYVRPRGIWLR